MWLLHIVAVEPARGLLACGRHGPVRLRLSLLGGRPSGCDAVVRSVSVRVRHDREHHGLVPSGLAYRCRAPMGTPATNFGVAACPPSGPAPAPRARAFRRLATRTGCPGMVCASGAWSVTTSPWSSAALTDRRGAWELVEAGGDGTGRACVLRAREPLRFSPASCRCPGEARTGGQGARPVERRAHGRRAGTGPRSGRRATSPDQGRSGHRSRCERSPDHALDGRGRAVSDPDRRRRPFHLRRTADVRRTPQRRSADSPTVTTTFPLQATRIVIKLGSTQTDVRHGAERCAESPGEGE